MTSSGSRTQPVGLARYAREYYDAGIAADDVLGERPGYEVHPPMPVLFLLAHSIELALKAYLLHIGLSLKQIVALKHDLEACWDECDQNGVTGLVQLTSDDLDLLRLTSSLHMSTELRYIQTGFKRLPVFGPLQELAKKILDPICPYVGYK